MPINVYLLNRTYIAQDSTTGLVAYGTTEKIATEKLSKLLEAHWEKKKVVVPVMTDTTSELGIINKVPNRNS